MLLSEKMNESWETKLGSRMSPSTGKRGSGAGICAGPTREAASISGVSGEDDSGDSSGVESLRLWRSKSFGKRKCSNRGPKPSNR